jgi:BirA family biotin operon repressor/biotin-[acetyl-CoA-carboxylase] ligase
VTRRPDLPSPCRLVAFDTLGSTNEEARRLATDGAPAWTFVWAREQTAGRGRRGNGWISPPGNMYLSAILRPVCAPATAAQLGFVVALALSDAIAVATGLQPRLKWPNDLLIDGRKVSGILIESTGTGAATVEWVVVGTGVNIDSHPVDLAKATDLAEQGARVDVVDMVEAYAAALRARVGQWQEGGFSGVRRDWLDRSSGLGAPIRVRLADREEQGVFEDLDETGALVLVQGARRKLITSGDVFPAGAA